MAQNQIFRGTARAIRTNESTGTKSFFYHNTPVVSIFKDGSIALNSAGFQSVTTKRAMNQASNEYNLGFTVYQLKGLWLVTWKGETIPFFDHIHLK